ncbi:carboxypeptidase-like regulatory domain-containing protein [Hymenobacter guriensis]|uniref:Carboxypeptidase-like regulatory domain-containing protein n=1 Tax=Hymenobacter guriensis TaxID=2793065 RepID=A0ABS0L0Q5_9BACT|nr:carboxypeptidase-like regulatory domain-containing protein [Hymenobacter guriensis]MBG8553684.1 carboxypeptidase-like regulatory domain-containing protein [Hymenobacter guriensis]
MSQNPYENDNAAWEEEERALSAGNTRLGLIVGAVLLLAGLGIAFAPGTTKKADGTSSSFAGAVLLDGEASVTGTAEKPVEAVATEEEADAADPATKTVTKTTTTTKPAAPAVATAATVAAPATEAAAPAAAAVEEAPVAAAPAPAVEEAPATTNLKGRVLDENGQPMAGATVFLNGSKKIASTDANGNYTIEVPVGENTLTYGYGGYNDQVTRARTGQAVNVTLLPKDGAKRRRR